jgi:hypothetical protein
MTGDEHERRPDPVASFEAVGRSVCVWSEKFGVEVWLVPEATGEERIELTAAAAREFTQVTEILGGEILELREPGGRVRRPVPGWEERVRERKLLEHEVRYDLLLDRERELRARLDARSATTGERDRVRKEWEAEVAELNRLIAEIAALGHEMTDVEVREGFAGALRRQLAGEDVAPAAASPPPAGEELSPSGGALTVESARDILRRERLLGAIGGP